MSDVSQIDGNAVRLQRESQGWALSDLATRACLSVKQVRQIEEGGMTAFYSETVKLTAARKIAALLHMSEKQLFGQTLSSALPVEVEAQEDHLSAPSTTQALGLAQWGGLNNQINPISRSEVLHELAQPPSMWKTMLRLKLTLSCWRLTSLRLRLCLLTISPWPNPT